MNTARFDELDEKNKIIYIKAEFCGLVKQLFLYPEHIRYIIDAKLLTVDEAQKILQFIFSINNYDCVCCKMLMTDKIKVEPIAEELYPLIDVAVNNLKTKQQ